ncbi:MAG: glycine cleavage system protein GcvH [Tissierellia bacterium]|jgi:glycine cleavage system H protein|nr:glycine cleavage system protein GcvH [Tissierellia bacterium]
MSKLFFTNEHEYVQVKDGIAYVGISDYAQDQLGDIVYVELPELELDVAVGDPIGVVESVKSASDIFSPVSGKVVEINEALEDQPELLNEDPMENWIAAVQLSDESELDELMDEVEYKAFLESEA